MQVVGIVGGQGVFQQHHTAQAQTRSQGGRLTRMVGLQASGGDQGVGALCQGVGGQVFEFAYLVAAQRQGRGVVALDVNIASSPQGQSFEFFQGGGSTQQFQTIKTCKLLFDHGDEISRK